MRHIKKRIWPQPDRKSARRAAAALIDDYGKRFPEAVRCLEECLEDSLSFYDFPDIDKKKISSTNWQEWLNMEIRWRSRVVRIFPSVESYVRLTICYLIEYAEDWESERNCIREDKVLGSLNRLHELIAPGLTEEAYDSPEIANKSGHGLSLNMIYK